MQNASHDDVKSVCDLYAGDISISVISRDRQQWFAYASEFGLETSCEGLLARVGKFNPPPGLNPGLTRFKPCWAKPHFVG